MSAYNAPSYAATAHVNPHAHANASRSRQRSSGDVRNGGAPSGPQSGYIQGNGPMPVPGDHAMGGRGGGSSAQLAADGGAGSFDVSRSPPGTKNTSHVPCKFFRQGACQAGKACPFSHSTDPALETAPCKYFTKGNCKFGQKCALAHILPDGRRVNKPALSMGQEMAMGRMMPIPPHSGGLDGAAGGFGRAPYNGYYPGQGPRPDDFYVKQSPSRGGPGGYDMIPTIDTTFSSHPGSAYGSPPNEGRLPISPQIKGLSALDAPLPASFDSQGISERARYGPIAASMPSKFALDSPPGSLPVKSPLDGSSMVQRLHDSAFGDDRRSSPRTSHLAINTTSSPGGMNMSTTQKLPMSGRRIVSEHLSSANPRLMSSSLGAERLMLHHHLNQHNGHHNNGSARDSSGDEWDNNFPFEEELVPSTLNYLLTPQERMRRFSRGNDENDPQPQQSGMLGLNQSGLSNRNSLAISTPISAIDTTKVGSPSHASPSRFGAFFARKVSSERTTSGSGDVDYLPSGSQPRTSAFGHVGSPLRSTSSSAIGGGGGLNPSTSSATLKALPLSPAPHVGGGDPSGVSSSGSLNSPPRQSSVGATSMLSQQLQRTRLSSPSNKTNTNANTISPLDDPSGAGSRSASGSGLTFGSGRRSIPSATLASLTFGALPATGIGNASTGAGVGAGAGVQGGGSAGGAYGGGGAGKDSPRPAPRTSEEGLFSMEDDVELDGLGVPSVGALGGLGVIGGGRVKKS